MAALAVTLLGRFDVVLDGRTVELPPGPQRALLAAATRHHALRWGGILTALIVAVIPALIRCLPVRRACWTATR